MMVRFNSIPALHEDFRGKEDLVLNPAMFSPEIHQPEPMLFKEEQNPHLCGSVFNILFPYPRVPWLPGFAGSRLVSSWRAQTVWVRPTIPDDWYRRENLGWTPHRDWMDRLLVFLRYIVENYGAEIIPATDLTSRGIGDLLIAVMGAERAYFAMYEHPKELKSLLGMLADIHIEWGNKQLEIIPPMRGGYCNPYGIFAPGRMTRFQEDFAGMISRNQFFEFLMPYEQKIVDSFEYAVLHTHSGVPQLAEYSLEMNGLKAIDFVLDPNAKPIEELLPLLNKVLEKLAVIVSGVITRKQLDRLVTELSPGGLLLDVAIEEELERKWG